jgi:D-alanyl-lipoteichoic acid acyltransferase DltB (MBOAT superfamily)
MSPIDIHKLADQLSYHATAPLIFNSGLFLFLFLLFVVVYIPLSRTLRPKLIYVTLFSLYFYYKSSGIYVLALIFTTLSDFLLGREIYKAKSAWKRASLLVLSLCVNLGMLGYFKYTNFLHEIFSMIAGLPYQPLDIFLPVGISFFTFQSLSYTIDIYRGHLTPVPHWINYAFFVSFFPQLVAGPIVRAADFIPQIEKPAFVSKEMLGRGVFLICTGLFKKAVISDYLGINFVDRIFDAPALYTGLENLLALYGYALQIYCDFSGYSDMAIGIALLLGFHFPPNFLSPYQAGSITEFWRRWHISLSTWLRDYLYISLGGNRKGNARTYVNLILTMLLGGLWHGASFRFILWGGLHGVALALHKAFSSVMQQWHITAKPHAFTKALSVLLTFHFVCFCWIFFRASDMEVATTMLAQIMEHFNGKIIFDFINGYRVVALLMLIGFLLHFTPIAWENRAQQWVTSKPLVIQALCVVVVILLVIQTKAAGIQPFIYFQF